MYRLMSSKHSGMWRDEDCKAEFVWFIPFVNFLGALVLLGCYLIDTGKLRIKLPKSKWFNTDL